MKNVISDMRESHCISLLVNTIKIMRKNSQLIFHLRFSGILISHAIAGYCGRQKDKNKPYSTYLSAFLIH
jgi:hypothetical protein